MTLNGKVMIKVTNDGHISVEVIKIKIHTMYHICTDQIKNKLNRKSKYKLLYDLQQKKSRSR